MLAAPGDALAQCAMCRTALTGSPEGQAMGGAFNQAILLLLAAPYVVFAVIAGVLVRQRVRARRNQPVARILETGPLG